MWIRSAVIPAFFFEPLTSPAAPLLGTQEGKLRLSNMRGNVSFPFWISWGIIMRDRTRMRFVTILLIGAVLAGTTVATQAIKLGDIVKVGGVAFIVDKFGSQINDFVNKITANKNAGTTEATAVVPILSLGGGGYIGAVQVIGAQENVDNCKAVVQIEANAVFGKNLRVKALVPVGSRTTSSIKRIYGVGVSAIIDIRI